jgi:hypothetical protein
MWNLGNENHRKSCIVTGENKIFPDFSFQSTAAKGDSLSTSNMTRLNVFRPHISCPKHFACCFFSFQLEIVVSLLALQEIVGKSSLLLALQWAWQRAGQQAKGNLLLLS